jgi:hypothetical protein
LAKAWGSLIILEKHMEQNINDLPPKLSAMAWDKNWIKLMNLPAHLKSYPQTVRKNFCLTGECYGIKPTKWVTSYFGA